MIKYPQDWQESYLGEGVELISGQHILAEDYSNEPVGVPYLTGPADFADGIIQVTKYTSKPKRLCESGDILITVKGSGTGKVILADQQYCISRQLMAIRPKKWNAKYLFAYLQGISHQYQGEASGLIPGIAREDILNTPIFVPPLPEQRKIAEILSTWDDAIATVDALIAALQRRKQGLMQRLLTGQVRFAEFEGSEWSSLKAGEIFESVSVRNHGDEELLSVTQDQGVIPRSMLDTRLDFSQIRQREQPMRQENG